MIINSDFYVHPSDKAALAALKAIPGFSQVAKAFMKVWDEKQYKIMNMSTNLKLSEHQLKKYYDMLPPICEKLGIEIPELYVKLDVSPNAYTWGDTNPFIVITSGLFETMPDELIPTVLAHECGHIACHHALYTTMGHFILNNAGNFVSGLGNIALYPIQLAYAYWMRCSEFSADRAAMLYNESSDKIVEMCMRFAGYDKHIMAEASSQLFIEQAKEYKALVDGNAVNKAMEFFMFSGMDHPLNAVRAYEANEWENGYQFKTFLNYIHNYSDLTHGTVKNSPKKHIGKTDDETGSECPGEIRIPQNWTNYLGKNYLAVKAEFEAMGFKRIVLKEITIPKLGFLIKLNLVAKIMLNGNNHFEKDTWYTADTEVLIYYYASV